MMNRINTILRQGNGVYNIPIQSGWVRKLVLPSELRREISLHIYDNDGGLIFSLDNWTGDSNIIYPFAKLERVSDMQIQTTYIYAHEYITIEIDGLIDSETELPFTFYIDG